MSVTIKKGTSVGITSCYTDRVIAVLSSISHESKKPVVTVIRGVKGLTPPMYDERRYAEPPTTIRKKSYRRRSKSYFGRTQL